MTPEFITKPGRMEHLLSKRGACTEVELFKRGVMEIGIVQTGIIQKGSCINGVLLKGVLYIRDVVQNRCCKEGVLKKMGIV